MLYGSYKYVLEHGFYLNVKFQEYSKFKFNTVLKSFFGISQYRFKFYLLRLEYQINYNRYKIPTEFNKKFLEFYKIINFYLLQLLPVYYKFKSLNNLYILRKWKIRTYEGRCHLKGKPVHGQRTWSNARTAKFDNTYVRDYLKELKRTSNSSRMTDQWA